jgi:heptose I phosphotransferase
VRRFVSSADQARLSSYGLADVATLLTADDRGVPATGEWTLLSKPGLRGRRRFRWQPLGSTGPTLYVKQFSRLPIRRQIDRINRQNPSHSLGWWEYRQAQRFRDSYLPAPAAIAAVEDMRGIFERRSAVVLESAPGDAFDRVWPRLVAAGSLWCEPRGRRRLIQQVAQLASALHQSGFCHRDLYLCHVFIDLDPGSPAPPRLTIIDLGRTHAPRFRRMRWLIKDLAQLDASARQIGATRTDRHRFLLCYLGLQARARRSRVYARRVARKSDAILRRIARKSERRT